MGRETGVGTLGVGIGVTARDERGLFFDRGRDGACRKSSGMSFHCPDVGATMGVEVPETARVGVETDFGGGGGRFGFDIVAGGGFETCSVGCPEAFLSQPLSEDCILWVVVCGDVQWVEVAG